MFHWHHCLIPNHRLAPPVPLALVGPSHRLHFLHLPKRCHCPSPTDRSTLSSFNMRWYPMNKLVPNSAHCGHSPFPKHRRGLTGPATPPNHGSTTWHTRYSSIHNFSVRYYMQVHPKCTAHKSHILPQLFRMPYDPLPPCTSCMPTPPPLAPLHLMHANPPPLPPCTSCMPTPPPPPPRCVSSVPHPTHIRQNKY